MVTWTHESHVAWASLCVACLRDGEEIRTLGERLFMCARTCIHVSVPLGGSSGGQATRGERERGYGGAGAGVLCGEALSLPSSGVLA